MADPSDNSITYYREREQHELKLADNAASPAIRDLHLEMAACYNAKVAQREDFPNPEEPPRLSYI